MAQTTEAKFQDQCKIEYGQYENFSHTNVYR